MKTHEIIHIQQGERGALFAFFSIWSFLLLCRPQDYIPALVPFRLALVFSIVTLSVYIIKCNSRSEYTVNKQLKLYLILFVMLIISVPFSYYPRFSLQEVLKYTNILFFVYIFYQIVDSTQKVRLIILMFCVGITIYASYILLSGSYLDNRISYGSMFDSNDIAYVIVSFLPFNFLFISKDNKFYIRVAAIVNMLVCVLVILKTGSRGGVLALSLVAAVLLFTKSTVLSFSIWKKVFIGVSAIIIMQFVDFNSERLRTIFSLENDYNLTEETGRVAIWKTGIQLMLTHPFSGVGMDRFPEVVALDREKRGLPPKWQAVHNSLIQIGAETGLFGFLVFSLLCFNVFKISNQIVKGTQLPDLAMISEVAKLGFLGQFVSSMFISQAYSAYFAFFIALSAVLKRMHEEEVSPKLI